MLPVPSFAAFQTAWLEIKRRGYSLHGFLLFAVSDHNFPEFLADHGLADLEFWTGSSCALFVLHSPSSQWVSYTRQSGHLWWQLFGVTQTSVSIDGVGASSGIGMSPNTEASWKQAPYHDPSAKEAEITAARRTPIPRELDAVKDQPLIEVDGQYYTISDLFLPCCDEYQHTAEIQKVLDSFALPPTSHPCLVFFRDVDDEHGWFVSLDDLVNIPKQELRMALKKWFGGPQFKKLLKEAGRG
jgi:hypothetical protein